MGLAAARICGGKIAFRLTGFYASGYQLKLQIAGFVTF